MNIRDKQLLIEFVSQGNQVKYLFFWGHKKSAVGLSATCLSQWYEASFEVDGICYPTAEHFMMAEKARLFKDSAIEEAVIAADNPGKAKALGREVMGFDNEIWTAHRFDIVVNANLEKFGQNPSLKAFLLKTGSKILVEASPTDRIWGIGLTADSSDAKDPALWQGLNLLGFALMEVRARLFEKC